MNTKLTPKQRRFVEEYLIDLNATQAAARAGYSPKTARQIASENLAKPDIQEAIAKEKIERSEATKIDAEWVLRQAVELYLRCMQQIRPRWRSTASMIQARYNSLELRENSPVLLARYSATLVPLVVLMIISLAS